MDETPGGRVALDIEAVTDDPAGLTDAELLDAAVVFERQAAWAAARQMGMLAEFGRRRPAHDTGAAPVGASIVEAHGVSRYAADEVGLALRLSPGSAAIRLEQSLRLVGDLAETLAEWEAGRLDHTKVRAVLDATAPLDPAAAAAVQSRVLPRAAGQTAGRLRAALARAVLAVDAEGANRRHERARRARRVAVNPGSEGMATLAALLPAPEALSAYEWLTRLAKGMGADDPRRLDARRADLLVALLTGRLTVAGPNTGPNTGLDTVPGSAMGEAAVPSGAGGEPAAPDRTSGGGSGAPDATRSAASGPIPHGRPGTFDGAIERSLSDPAAGPAVADPTAGPAVADSAAGSVVTDRSVGSVGGSHAGGADPERVPMPVPVNPGKPLIQVTIPYDALTGRTDEPGHLVGYGPLPADLARRIAADAVWKRLVTDPLSGALLDHGRTTYRPPAALAEFVRARDLTCRHPTCRRPAAASELDHAIAWSDGGDTAAHNLYSSCGRHHHLKHDVPGWRVTLHPDATITWTTPTGHRYASHPHDYRPDRAEEEPDHTRYILERSARAGPAPPPRLPPIPVDDPPPF